MGELAMRVNYCVAFALFSHPGRTTKGVDFPHRARRGGLLTERVQHAAQAALLSVQGAQATLFRIDNAGKMASADFSCSGHGATALVRALLTAKCELIIKFK